MNLRLTLFAAAAITSAAAAQDAFVQSDWAGGPGQPGPVSHWADSFASTTGLSWQSIPDQVCLEATPLAEPVQTIFASDANLPRSVNTGDIDGDGIVDVIHVDPIYTNPLVERKGAVYWWKRSPNGDMTRHVINDDFYGARYANAADVDGDGDMDVIACAYYGLHDYMHNQRANGRYVWFENLDGAGQDWTKHTVGEFFWGAYHIDSGDVDGDGDIDFVGISYLTEGQLLEIIDGRLITVNDGDVVLFENLDGAGLEWAQHDLDDDLKAEGQVTMADMDADGDKDIVAAGTGIISWFENTGADWPRHDVVEFRGNGIADVGDIDGDGDLDIVGNGYNTTSMFWVENLDGQASLWTVHLIDAFNSGEIVHLVDVEGDGDLDVVATRRTGTPAAEYFENLGSGSSWQRRIIKLYYYHPQASGETSIAVGDINGDGRLDAVTSNAGTVGPGEVSDEQLCWFDLSTFDTDGDLTSSVLDGGAPDWSTIQWDADVPAQTELGIEVRAGDDAQALGPWMAVTSGDDLASYIDPASQYLQYRVSMTSNDANASPILRELSVRSGGCAADFNGDGTVNTLDFLAYLNVYNAGDASADLNGDGVVNTLDFLAFLNLFNEGC